MKPSIARRFAVRIGAVASGVLAAFLVIEIVLRLAGAWWSHQQLAVTRLSPSTEAVRILCIGESTTALGDPPTPAGAINAYPSQLEMVLNEALGPNAVTVVNGGVPAHTTERIIAGIESRLDEFDPDIVVAMMGINDGDDEVVAALPIGDQLRVVKLARALWGAWRPADTAEEATFPELLDMTPDTATGASVQEVTAELLERPGDASLLIALAEARIHNGEVQQAESILLDLRQRDPRDARVPYALGVTNLHRRQYREAERPFREAIEIAPDWPPPTLHLAFTLNLLGASSEARAILDSFLERYPDSASARWVLLQTLRTIADAQRREGEKEEAHRTLEAALHVGVQRGSTFARQAVMLMERGDLAGAEAHFALATRERLARNNPRTERSYHRLKDILDERGITLVAVQYPMRPLAALTRWFADSRGIVFVDNEKSFKDAVVKASFATYFWDDFASDFGHLTKAGARLLAENVARAIREEIIEPQRRQGAAQSSVSSLPSSSSSK